jgi:integrative and conjugative element protein (TIGR02256 family)
MRNEGDLEFLSTDFKYGLVIQHKSLKKLLQICRATRNLEVGGIIIGAYDAEHRYAWVRSISNAPSDSLSSRYWFQRGIHGLQYLLDKYWYQKQFYYLGEWHLHPNASARASSVDIEQMISISQSNMYNCPEPVLVILGGDPRNNWEIRAYVFPRNKAWAELNNIKSA